MYQTFDPYSYALPVSEIIPSVKKYLSESNTLIVSAPPGAGKSTLLPLTLLNEDWLGGRKIIMLEPRRLAAGTIAHRMAAMLGEPVGRTVGYRIRFERKISAQTCIEVVTEGVLTRMLHQDNALEEFGLVIFDEFHERSIHADVAMALCRESQQVLRPDLRIMVMSATLNRMQLAGLLSAPVAESRGAVYPVDVIYTGEYDPSDLPASCARVIHRALSEQEGDILAFLPGQGEIRKCEALLLKSLNDVLVRPLYGQLSFAEQNAAITPDPMGRRRVVLATSIAETSLTIEGVNVVIDSGLARTPVFDARTGLSGLRTGRISADSAAQRTGRAGRLGPGVCYRMWSLATQGRMAAFRTPEILEADLAPMMLDMVQWGVKDVRQLCWLDVPPAGAVGRATEVLHNLKALEDDRMTPHGRAIHRLPCHPRIAHMLLMAAESGLLPLATDLAALLEERDPLEKEAGIDISLRIDALRSHRSGRRRERRWENIERVAVAYRRLFDAEPDNGYSDAYAVGRLLAFAYPERIAAARPGHAGQFLLANGKTAAADREDELAGEQFLAVAQVDDRKGAGKIFLAAPLNAGDVLPLTMEVQVLAWDTRRGGLIASSDRRLGSIVLQSRPLATPGEEEVARVIVDAIKNEGESLLSFTEEVEQWQNRMLSLRIWRPGEDWPDVSTAALLERSHEWLPPFLAGVKRPEDMKKIDLLQAIAHSLDYGILSGLGRLAPLTVKVPSGSDIRLKYMPDGAPPVLAVRLQEVFGMLDTPRVNEGRQPVLLHLLSPGYKPVQVTSDLRSFWQNTYFEVRKELKRRYPKHSWPEDPLNAEAVRGIRRKT